MHNLAPTPVTFNLSAIDNRINSLQSNHLSTAYSNQKQSLKIELESFLFALADQKSLFDATPLDVCRFLVFKDSTVKRKFISPDALIVANGAFPFLNAFYIFSDVGRQGDWNRTLLLGNPATYLLVKQYLKEAIAEQLQARVTPKQGQTTFAFASS